MNHIALSVAFKKRPIKQSIKVVHGFADAHPMVVVVLAGLATLALGALLVWFLIFSGYNEPVPFIYDEF